MKEQKMDDSHSRERKSFLAATDACFERGDDETALDLAQSRLEKIPGDILARIVICRAWMILGRIDEARRMLAEILDEVLSDLSRLYEVLGDLSGKKGREEEAGPSFVVVEGLKADALEESPGGEEPGTGGGAEGSTEIAPDFETVTLAELYMRQGHYRMAEDLLVKIIAREPADERAAGLLRDVRARLAQEQTGAVKGKEDVVNELSKWLKNIGGLGRHA